MKLKMSALAVVLLAFSVLAHDAPTAQALGLNTGMLYRYPWAYGDT